MSEPMLNIGEWILLGAQGSRCVKRLSSDSSSVKVVALVSGSKEAPTFNSVMDLRTRLVDDGSEYLPC